MSFEAKTMGDFEVIREIGRGGMGVVYEARQASLNRKVALKVLGGILGRHPKAVERFKREAEAAARLHHTNIVPIYAIGEEDGYYFYAMELIEGPSLDDLLRSPVEEITEAFTKAGLVDCDATEDGRLPSSNAGETSSTSSSLQLSSVTSDSTYFDNIASQMARVADALELAHAHRIVHRDIKPSNILVRPDGRFSLNDFGLARVANAPNVTATGEMLGTPTYMSPEQIAAGRTALDHRTDIYSFGATLYKVLTLRAPFQGESRDQVLTQILHKEPTPPRRINRRVPIDLETICLKSMEKDPDKRYQTAAALAKDLERYVNRFEISARRVGPIGKAIKWVRRNPGVSAGIAFGSLALLIAIGFANQARHSERLRVTQQHEADESMRLVRLNNALDDATVAATSGDLLKAENAIRDAESTGASAAQVRMLRGQVAFFNGDFADAMVHLQAAEALSPESPAPKALLAQTYLHLGYRVQRGKILQEMLPLKPATNMDFLFKGYALYWTRPDLGLDYVAKACERSKSPLAKVIQAEVRMMRAEETLDPELAKLALEELNAARAFLPDNPMVLAVSLFTKSVASNIFARTGRKSEQAALLIETEQDFKDLEAWQSLPYPAFAIWEYLNRVGRKEELMRFAKDGSTALSSVPAQLRYAAVLCRARRFREAQALLSSIDSSEVDGNWFKSYIAAEISPEAIAPTINQLRRFQESTPEVEALMIDGPREFSRRALLTLGDEEGATAAYREELSRITGETFVDFHAFAIRYGARQISENELIDAAQGPWNAMQAYSMIGLTQLARGNRKEALKHFKLFKEVGVFGEPQQDIILTFVEQMERDPTWPQWIPLNDGSSTDDYNEAERQPGP